MSKRIFSSEQVEDLLKNPNVVKCSSKSISYNKKFKAFIVEQARNSGMPIRHIFQNAGFDLKIIGKDTPAWCLKRWKKIFNSKGISGLITDRRGTSSTGRPKTKGITDAEKINRLEATVAYLRAENDFLAKLRTQRKR